MQRKSLTHCQTRYVRNKWFGHKIQELGHNSQKLVLLCPTGPVHFPSNHVYGCLPAWRQNQNRSTIDYVDWAVFCLTRDIWCGTWNSIYRNQIKLWQFQCRIHLKPSQTPLSQDLSCREKNEEVFLMFFGVQVILALDSFDSQGQIPKMR